ncbi:filamentous hemagglutinin N-terminal domain-containing protein [Phormidium sp. CLA17]|uniref:two-partner secretion domain-containing protein n=1 Tax=Leptolyngbya sp. Cla-17 TaxID=2803751 RepID=UPI001490D296|nr:filamentous hemagglutinin N-terminal domain-containing protein [Leptolyngbya sp. Cla-17]MBM0744578.1 filamentous hemagglutinin N-terminal domain-containing protein [Leptolyngbya sp. Cla-17]
MLQGKFDYWRFDKGKRQKTKSSRNALFLASRLLSPASCLLFLLSLATPTVAQVVPDASLGSTTSINGIRTDINGGLRRGSALFHSFERFGILTNHQVYFSNPAGIRNIFSRVTGGSISNIDGLLGVSGGANLFFMNPSGIIFGPNARLDVSGSFLATTASALEFPDGQKFAATGDRAVPLVEVNIPIGLQFGANPPAMLNNQGILTAGKDLTLAAATVTSSGSLNAPKGTVIVTAGGGDASVRNLTAQTATLSASNNLVLNESQLQTTGDLTLVADNTVIARDSNTTPFLARARGNLRIQGQQGIDILALRHPAQTPFQSGGDLTLVSDGIISTDAHFYSRGNFAIKTSSGLPANFVSLYDPIISSQGDVSFGSYTGAALKVEAIGSITITGDIIITGPDTTSRSAAYGDFDITTDANGTVVFLRNGPSSATAGTLENVLGLTAGSLNGLNAPTQAIEGSGLQSTVTTTADNQILSFNWEFLTNEGGAAFNDFSFVSTTPNGGLAELADLNFTLTAGNSGFGRTTGIQTFSTTIPINGTNVDLGLGVVDGRDGAVNSGLRVSNFRLGADPIPANNQVLPLTLSSDPDIAILNTGPALILRAGVAQLANPTDGPPPATVNAGTLNTTFNLSAPPSPGTITINGAINTSAAGNGGQVIMDASGDITLTGSISSASTGTGNAGSINLSSAAGNVSLTGGGIGLINASSVSGNGGNVTINTPAGTASLTNLGLNTDTTGLGKAGNVVINAPTITLTNAQVSAGVAPSAVTSNPPDTQLFLFNSAGTLIATNDDRSLLSLDSGSVTRLDSYLDVIFPAADTYYLGIGEFPSSSTGSGVITGQYLDLGDNYTLHISVENHNLLDPNARGDLNTENGTNNSFAQAQNLEALSFSVAANPDIDNAITIPHISVTGSGNGTSADFFAFNAAAGTIGIFDIDTSGGGQAGNISLNAPGGLITMTGSSLSNRVSGPTANTADISVVAAQFQMLSGSQIDASTVGEKGDGGNVVINTSTLTNIDSSSIQTTVGAGATGSGGNIEVTTRQFRMTNGGSLDTGNDSTGCGSAATCANPVITTGGDVTITASGSVLLENNSTIRTAVDSNARGNGGNITITGASFLSLTGGSRLSAQTAGVLEPGQDNARAGNVSISNIAGAIEISGSNSTGLVSGLFTSTERQESGRGGNITINSSNSNLQVTDRAVLNASTQSASDGGDIEVTVDRLGALNGGQLTTTAFSTGAAGDITVTAPSGVNFSGSAPPPSIAVSPFAGVTSITELTGANFNNLNSDPNIESATTIPHVTLTPIGNGIDFPYFGFTVRAAGSIGIFDIDAGYETFGALGSIDTELFLFNRDTGQLLATNDDNFATPLPGAGGSTSGLDSYIRHAFQSPGNYIVGVGEYNSFASTGSLVSGDAPDANDVYTLNISLQAFGTPDTANPSQNPNSGLFAQALGTGNAGQVTVNSSQLTVANGAEVSTSTRSGISGDILVQGVSGGSTNLQVVNGSISASTDAGVGGSIILNGLNDLQLDNGQISASTQTGQAGSLSVNAANSVTLNNGSALSVAATGSGNSGAVSLTTQQLTVNNSQISATTTSGVGGDVTLQGLDFRLDNGQISASTQTGQAGSLNVNAANSVTLNNSSALSVAATGSGNAGAVSLTTQQLTVNNSQISATTTSGVGGDVTLQGLNTLQMDNGRIAASTETGRAGNLSVDASNAIALNNNSLLSVAGNGATSGDSGNITLTTPQLTISNSQISASTGGGIGGNVSLQGLSTLQLDNGQVRASTETGRAGNLSVDASNAIALNNSSLSVEATGQTGNSGNVTLTTPQLSVNNSKISASTVGGVGGNVTLQGLNSLQMNNGQVSASTETGQAGDLNVNVSGDINLTNNSRLAVEATGANGVAGDITINGRNITLQNSEVLASSRQGRSGNIRITGRRLDLQNGTIKAETGQSTGARSGSIDLDLSFRLTLEDESEISTLGLNGADGGDITILNVRFLFGKPPTGSNGSDIVGRADGGGRGGRVFLERKTLVQGFSFRRAEPGNRTNDIDTNGQLANFSTDADVGARGLSTALIVFNDVSQIVRSACEAAGANTETNTELKISGRGGVPISPTVSLSAKDTTSDWVSLELSPQVSVGITLPDGTTETLQQGQIYHLQAICVNGWKGQQRSLL